MKIISIIWGIILILLLSSINPIASMNLEDCDVDYKKIHNTIDNFNMNILWGYVTDEYGVPFEGARVRIYFNDYYLETNSRPDGIYRITDIPITNYLKNVTAYMEGYLEKWVYLPLINNTYHDFKLEPNIKNLYVGGDGDNNFSRIKDAIKKAKNGNTIYVYNGVYKETFWITEFQDIKLIGEDKQHTIIEGENTNNVISISQSTGIIKDFTIRNVDIEGESNFSAISIGSSTFNISDVIFSYNKHGVFFSNPLFYRKTIRINECVFENNEVGIRIDFSTAIIVNNEIVNNKGGIYFTNGNSGIIKNNNIRDNSEYGVKISFSFSNDIYLNNFERNKIGLAFPLSNPGSEDNNIWHNNFLWNRKNGYDYHKNNYHDNYWSDWVGHYFDFLDFMPYFIRPIFTLNGFNYNFDMSPLRQPYNI